MIKQLFQVDDVGDVVGDQVVEIFDGVDDLRGVFAQLVRFQDLIAQHAEQSFQSDFGLFFVQLGNVQMPAGHQHVLADAPGVRCVVRTVYGVTQRRGHLVFIAVEQTVIEPAHIGRGDVRIEQTHVLGRTGLGPLHLGRPDEVHIPGQHRGIIIIGVISHQVRMLVRVVVRVCVADQSEFGSVVARRVRVIHKPGVRDAEHFGQLNSRLFGFQVEEADGSIEIQVLLVNPVQSLLLPVRMGREDCFVVEKVENVDVSILRVFRILKGCQGKKIAQGLDIIKTCVDHGGSIPFCMI